MYILILDNCMLSYNQVDPSNSAGEDDTISEASVSDLSRFIPKMPLSPSAPHVISIGQLMESVHYLSCMCI